VSFPANPARPVKKGVQTLFMAARQVALLAPEESDLRKRAQEALPLPQYVVRSAIGIETLIETVTRTKTEVALVEAPEEGAPAVLEKLRAADPDMEILLVADPSRIDLRGLGATVDILERPVHNVVLARRVELARDRRYLRRAEQRRERLEARTSAIMQAVPTGILSFDEDHIIHDWNPSAGRIFGFSEVEVTGRGVWEMTGLDPAALRDADGRLALGKKLELSAKRRDGSSFPIDMSLVALPKSERNMTCAIVEDRSEAKRLEMELRQAQKLEAVGQLSAGLAHEINTPCQYIGDNTAFVSDALADVLALVASYRDLVGSAESGPADPQRVAALRQEEQDADLDYCLERLPRSLEGIADGVRRIAGIVAAMKSFARTDWSEGNSVDLNELVTNTLTVASHDLQAVADVETDLEQLPPIVGHGGDLHQALYQLVRNAIDAIAVRAGETPYRGKITVKSRRHDTGVALIIQDTGCGIPERIRGRVFEPFFTTKSVGKGTGQGLAVTWSIIVDQHGGRLTFDTTEGQGTTFYVHLPWAPARARVA
jgi:PAS domain S-box-containing protein